MELTYLYTWDLMKPQIYPDYLAMPGSALRKIILKKNLQEFHFNFVWLIKPLVLSAEFSAYKSAALTLQSKFLLGYVTGETATNL